VEEKGGRRVEDRLLKAPGVNAANLQHPTGRPGERRRKEGLGGCSSGKTQGPLGFVRPRRGGGGGKSGRLLIAVSAKRKTAKEGLEIFARGDST